jgi:hypothetical protein
LRVLNKAGITNQLAVSISLLCLCFISGLALFISQADERSVIWGLPLSVELLLLIPPVAALLTIALSILVVLEWKNDSWSVLGKFSYSSFTFAAIAFFLYLDRWNLLVPRM